MQPCTPCNGPVAELDHPLLSPSPLTISRLSTPARPSLPSAFCLGSPSLGPSQLVWQQQHRPDKGPHADRHHKVWQGPGVADACPRGLGAGLAAGGSAVRLGRDRAYAPESRVGCVWRLLGGWSPGTWNPGLGKGRNEGRDTGAHRPLLHLTHPVRPVPEHPAPGVRPTRRP